jgi:hypothetical protein
LAGEYGQWQEGYLKTPEQQMVAGEDYVEDQVGVGSPKKKNNPE